MANLNKIFLIGRLTRDPSMSSTKSGAHICKFSLAVNRKFVSPDGAQREEVEFLDITVLGRTADACFNYLRKGRLAFVEGRLHIDSWTDAKLNITRYRPEIISDRVEFLEYAGGLSEGIQPGVDASVAQAFRGVESRRLEPPPAPVAPLQDVSAPPLGDEEVF